MSKVTKDQVNRYAVKVMGYTTAIRGDLSND
jgi:hypothetical protein